MPKKNVASTKAPLPKSFSIPIGGQRHELTYEQAFAFGHSLIQGGHVAEADKIFRELAKVVDRGPRARIMLARCRAELEDFETCEKILQFLFKGEDEPVAEELQAAFVFHKIGMRSDAIRAMAKVVEGFQNLPTACLLLGDLFASAGKVEKATYCWNLAIQRDRKGGAVSLTASRQLAGLKKQLAGAPKARRSPSTK